MPTSAAGTCRTTDRHWNGNATVRAARAGFTLIEILVVVVIAAVIVGAVLMSASGLDSRRGEREGERLYLLLQLACEHAELSGREVGVHLAVAGFGFTQAAQDRWIPFANGHRLQERVIDGSQLIVPSVTLPEAPDYERAPQVICWPSSELSALDIRVLHAGTERARVRTGADARPLLEVSDEGRDWRPFRNVAP
jgi:general secretion pathway protein H